jgi:1-acyl-sn-glycerol-3-phosphate acyltransferase
MRRNRGSSERRPGRVGPWMGFAISVVRPLSTLLTKREWLGREHIPAAGGVIIAANHLSWVDPFTLGHFVYSAGRIPRFMAKSSLFGKPVIGQILRGADQIPVHRGERDGAAALSDAVQALHDGEAILIYPEGTITRDPDWWPMQAKTGVARLALMSGAPVVAVAQWGPQEILGRSRRLRVFPRKTMQIHAMEPLRAEPLAPGVHPTREQLRAFTVEVMNSVRAELEVIRDEPSPAGIWDPRLGERISAVTDRSPLTPPSLGEPTDRGAA